MSWFLLLVAARFRTLDTASAACHCDALASLPASCTWRSLWLRVDGASTSIVSDPVTDMSGSSLCWVFYRGAPSRYCFNPIAPDWWWNLRRAPAHDVIETLIMLHPHLAQDVYSRNLPEPLRCGGIKKGIQERSSLLANLFGQCLSFRFSHRHPLVLALSTQPIGSHHREAFERSTHGFPHTTR